MSRTRDPWPPAEPAPPRFAAQKDSSLTSFNDFGLAEPIIRTLAEEKYATPTPIQAQSIPLLLAGRDLIGIAQTGTGKTAAFALPILHRLAATPSRPERKTCRVLVLSPTRELSGQILDSFRTYGRRLRLQSTLAIGGVSMGAQVRALAHGVDILVATPGRLLDLVRGGALRLNRVEMVVLDEADRMLDMGFIHDIRAIVAKLPAQRQTLLFSATMPQAISELASRMLSYPAKVTVTPVASTVERISQRVVHVDGGAKPGLLADILRQEPIDRALVFTRTKHGADKVVRVLGKSGLAAEAIHGNKSQSQRERVLAAFRDGRVRTLIATDIAARGIDVEGISHVINYDLPNVPESYVHRIGRTARAGAEGIAISFCSADEAPFLRDIEKLIQMSIPATGEPARRRGADKAQQRPNGHNGHSARNGRKSHNNSHNGSKAKPGGNRHAAPRHNGGRNNRRDEQPSARQSAAHQGEITSVAFLKRKPEPRRDGARGNANQPRR